MRKIKRHDPFGRQVGANVVSSLFSCDLGLIAPSMLIANKRLDTITSMRLTQHRSLAPSTAVTWFDLDVYQQR